LRTGLEKARCVCKIHVSGGGSGTGFITQNQFLYTNHHVIDNKEKAALSQVEFGYDDPDMPSIQYDLTGEGFITSPSDGLDFARIKIKDRADKPLQQWGALTIKATQPGTQDVLTIIQHPQGRRQEIAFSDSGNSTWDHRLHYKVSTEPGSSGSPVFDIGWNVIAIHHAGGNLKVNEKGEIRFVNEGILFSHILKEIGDR
jgi:V8-like Glu-specific endopeptidase